MTVELVAHVLLSVYGTALEVFNDLLRAQRLLLVSSVLQLSFMVNLVEHRLNSSCLMRRAQDLFLLVRAQVVRVNTALLLATRLERRRLHE